MNVVIIGGGISGLSTAFFLRQRGATVAVLEAEAHAGGLIGSRWERGFLLESGPQSLIDREPHTRALVDALGLKSAVRSAESAAKKRFVFSQGGVREVPSSPPALLRSNLLSLRGKLRLFLEPLSRRGPQEDESLGAFARRHLGQEATSILVDAMQRGIFAGDLEKLSARSTFPVLHAWETKYRSLLRGALSSRKELSRGPWGTYTFEGGLSTLVDALSNKLGESLHVGARAKAVEQNAKNFRVTYQTPAGPQQLDADQVILALPAYAAAALLRPLSSPAAQALEAIRYAPVSAVQLGFQFSEGVSHALQGFGYLVPSREQRGLLGALFASAIFPFRAPPGTALVVGMVGGAQEPDRARLDDEALISHVRSELSAVLGITQPPVLTSVSRWEKAIPQYNLGHSDRLAEVDSALSKLPGLHLVGNWQQGVGINDCVRAAAELAAQVG